MPDKYPTIPLPDSSLEEHRTAFSKIEIEVVDPDLSSSLIRSCVRRWSGLKARSQIRGLQPAFHFIIIMIYKWKTVNTIQACTSRKLKTENAMNHSRVL